MKSKLLTAALLCTLSGCATSLLEERVITQFVDALEEENVPAIRRVVSTEFERKALRSDDVLRDLDIVKLPEGELEILDVDEPSDDRRSVVVTDESGDKFRFELVRDSQKQRWAVNDVLVRQQKKWKKVRSTVTWPTSQVLDLVFSVREYLDAWSGSQRNTILEKSSPALAASLQAVPEAWLPVITSSIAQNYDSSLARKPEAQLNDDAAVVRMPVRGGFLLVSAIQVDNRWLMDDIEIHSRSDSGHPGSIRRQADSVASLGRFLHAFEENDRELLQASATPQFYNATLQFGDLNLVSLPSANVAPAELSIRSFSGRITIIVPTEREFVRFDLKDPTYRAEKHIARDDAPRVFHVDNVILNDRTKRNERTLASVFTAPARASLFFTALESRDIGMLRQLSTREFNTAVWSQVNDDTCRRLTMPTSQLQGLKLEGSDVRGDRTELTFSTSEGNQITCRMYEQIGRLLVDDVQFKNADDQILSLRIQSALQVPISQFTTAWNTSDLDGLKETVSTAFDRLVLSNLTEFPPDSVHLAARLDTALQSTRVTEERATVNMGLNTSTTAEVHLVYEHDRWVIDDIVVPGQNGRTVAVKDHLRQLVVDKMRKGTSRAGRVAQSNNVVYPATNEMPPTRMARPVPQVNFAGATDVQDDGVVSAKYETFGPDRAEVERRLQNPAPAPETPDTPEVPTETPQPPEKLSPAPADTQLKAVPVPASTMKPDAQAGDFLLFGPATAAPAQTTSELAEKPSASDSAGNRLNLADNPVAID